MSEDAGSADEGCAETAGDAADARTVCRLALVGAPKDTGAPWRGASSAELSSKGVTRRPASIG